MGQATGNALRLLPHVPNARTASSDEDEREQQGTEAVSVVADWRNGSLVNLDAKRNSVS
jgi:hypothetical protein